MRYAILFFFLFNCLELLNGQVIIIEESGVRMLMGQYESQGKTEDFINGWRIKLVSTTDRRKLESTRYLFRRKYPDKVFSQSHENPYYSLKVGAFETRLDLEPLLALFKEDFPDAIPFRDQVMKSELFEEE